MIGRLDASNDGSSNGLSSARGSLHGKARILFDDDFAFMSYVASFPSWFSSFGAARYAYERLRCILIFGNTKSLCNERNLADLSSCKRPLPFARFGKTTCYCTLVSNEKRYTRIVKLLKRHDILATLDGPFSSTSMLIAVGEGSLFSARRDLERCMRFARSYAERFSEASACY